MKRSLFNRSIILAIAALFLFTTLGIAPLPKSLSPVLSAAAAETAYPDHVIINQIYGGYDKPDGAISHGFIELYNPTDQDVDLSQYSIQYAKGKKEWNVLKLTGETIKTHSSFLILCDSGVAVGSPRYIISNYDLLWDQVIDNEAINVALVSNQVQLTPQIAEGELAGIIDLVGAINTATDQVYNYEGSAPFLGISKQKSARRIDFSDTDVNTADFESLDYRTTGISNDRLEEVRPRYSGDGAWGIETVIPPVPIVDAATPNITIQPVDQDVLCGDTASISVTANVPKGTLSYQWFRNSIKSNAGGTAIAGATGSTYNIPTDAAGTSYYYCIVTNSDSTANGNKTAVVASAAAEVLVKEKVVVPPEVKVAAPTILAAAKADATSIKVSWAKASGVDGYEVWYTPINNGTYTKLSSTTGNSYTHKQLTIGKTYYYKIRAYKKVDGTTYYSNYTNVKSLKLIVSEPKNIKAKKAGKNSIKVSWKKVIGVTKYEVYRATSKKGKYKKVVTVNSKKSSYINKKLTKGKTYYYKVKAVQVVGKKSYYSVFSAIKSAKAK